MTEIPESLRLLFSSEIEQRDSRYQIDVPTEQIDRANSAIQIGESYRVAILKPSTGSDQPTERAQGPPVEEGDVRTVTIEAIGKQGDGIAKVERGYVLVVPGGEPGDELSVRVKNVSETVGFAEMINGQEPE